MPLDPITMLAWLEFATTTIVTIGDVTRRLQSGVNATPEDLERLKAETKAALARWDAAAVFDRPNTEG